MGSRGGSGTWEVIAGDAGDFDGDGRDDVLWRDAFLQRGTVTNWLGQANGSFLGNFEIGSASADPNVWRLGAIGDFNGDGRSDVLWWTFGNPVVTNWLATPEGGFVGNYANAAASTTLPWFLVGSGDFNGDGRSDILWRDRVTGTITNWLGQANGSFVGNFENASASASLEWGFAGTGDFNGDGRDDILWHNENGSITNWLGTESGGFVGNLDAAYEAAPLIWSVAGTGDFNGDGLTDILWQTPYGDVTNWLAQADGGFAGNYDTFANSMEGQWEIVSIGDFNGDGYDDILWKRPGEVTTWSGQEDGRFTLSDNPTIDVAYNWQVQPDPNLFG